MSTKCHKLKVCFFCDGTAHKLNDLAEVKDLVKRRQRVSSKKLCFKGLNSGHCAADSPSRTCFQCSWKHYTSLRINDEVQENSNKEDQEPKEEMLALVVERNVY